MDEQNEVRDEIIEEQPQYKSRPAWQVWGARIVLVLFLAFLFMYYVNLMRGGG